MLDGLGPRQWSLGVRVDPCRFVLVLMVPAQIGTNGVSNSISDCVTLAA